MVTGDLSEPLAPASLAIAVWDHDHDVRLDLLINFIYNNRVLGKVNGKCLNANSLNGNCRKNKLLNSKYLNDKCPHYKRSIEKK